MSTQHSDITYKIIADFAEAVGADFDVGESLQTAHERFPQVLSVDVSAFMFYNETARRLEVRVHTQTEVTQSLITSLVAQLSKALADANAELSDSLIAVNDESVILTGAGVSDTGLEEIASLHVTPVVVNNVVLGVSLIGSGQADQYSDEYSKHIIQAFITIATISSGRIATLLESQKTGIESLIKGLSNGVIMFGKDKKVQIANPAAVRFTGLPNDKYDLAELSTLFKGADLESLINRVLEIGETGHVERVAVAPFHYELSVMPVKSGDAIIGGAIVLHDITHAVEIDKMKTEFVSIAAHQLRTPLGSMRWFLEMLQAEDAGPLNDEQQDFVREVLEGNARMLELVNGLLNVSRLEAGRVAIEPVPAHLEEIISGVVKESTPIAKKIPSTITFNESKEVLPEMPLDIGLLHEVIANLVSNALRYGKQDGSGTVVVETNLKTGRMLNEHEWPSFSKPLGLLNSKKYVVISVEDNGIGIPENARGKVFSKFFRATNATAVTSNGTGLGLYMLKMIVESAGGSVWFESTEGKGTTFHVALLEDGMRAHEGERGLAGVDEKQSDEQANVK